MALTPPVSQILRGTPLWTPRNLLVKPQLMIRHVDAVWSGSDLASIVNSGKQGGSWSLYGTPDKGATINGRTPIRFDADTEALYKTFDMANTGKISVFWYGRLDTAGICGVVNRGWATNDDPKGVIYSNVSGAGIGSIFIANRTLTTDSAPAWELGSNGQLQLAGGINSVYAQCGTTNAAYVDGVAQTLTGTNLGGSFPLAGAAPDYASFDWEFGRGACEAAPATGEGAKSSFLCIALFDDWLSTAERQKLAGYYHHLGGTQAQLSASHPYRYRAPRV